MCKFSSFSSYQNVSIFFFTNYRPAPVGAFLLPRHRPPSSSYWDWGTASRRRKPNIINVLISRLAWYDLLVTCHYFTGNVCIRVEPRRMRRKNCRSWAGHDFLPWWSNNNTWERRGRRRWVHHIFKWQYQLRSSPHADLRNSAPLLRFATNTLQQRYRAVLMLLLLLILRGWMTGETGWCGHKVQ